MADRYIHELFQLSTFEERLAYLRINATVGVDTFGYDRYLNQKFYHSPEWKRLRNQIIVRDNGCDLGLPDRPIVGPIYIHHINPVAVEDIIQSNDILLLPEYLVCCSFDTHQAIHYGRKDPKLPATTERHPGDTCPWRNYAR